jgi:Ca2+-binding EF-hand superfamily protein
MAQYRECFDAFDIKKDGYISIKDLRRALHSLGHRPSDTELQALLREADTDNSGQVGVRALAGSPSLALISASRPTLFAGTVKSW